jgi:hypothetical protein
MSINSSENQGSSGTGIGVIFIVLTVLVLFLFMIVMGGMMFVKMNYDKEIAIKKQHIEELQMYIEQLAPLKLKIEEYKQLTEKTRKEINELKGGK